MAWMRNSDEDVLKLLREIGLKLADGDDVRRACRSLGVSDATYSNWRRRFGGMDPVVASAVFVPALAPGQAETG